jgi:fatty acid desaturase
MKESFHASQTISKTELKALMIRSDGPALRRFALQYLLYVGAALSLILGPVWHLPIWSQLIAGCIFTLLTMAMFAISHETSHNTAFHSRALNRWVLGLAGIPIYYTPTGFREFHFAHHRFTHDSKQDPEISVGGKPGLDWGSNILFYLVYVSGLPLLLFKCSWLMAAALSFLPGVWSHFLVFIPAHARQRQTWEARGALLLHLTWILAGLLFLPGLLYLLLAQWLGHSLLSFYLLTEHTGLPESGSILGRTRTTQTTALLKWLMWNMPYHAEHHAYPAIPWHALPKTHSLIKSELKASEKGYLHFHWRVLSRLLRGKVFREN